MATRRVKITFYFHWKCSPALLPRLFEFGICHSPATHQPGCHIGCVCCVMHKFTWQRVQTGAEIHPVLRQPSHHESESLFLICTVPHGLGTALLISCLTSGALLNLSRFPHLYNGETLWTSQDPCKD